MLVSDERFFVNGRFIDETIAIARIGERRIAGVVNMMKSKDGIEFPAFFTGHSDQPLPILFMTETGPDCVIEYDLTGKSIKELGQENNREIDVYYAFAMQVFQQNLSADQYDFYAAINAAIWLRDSKLVSPETFTVAPVDPEVIKAASQMVMDSKQGLDHFVSAVKASTAQASVH